MMMGVSSNHEKWAHGQMIRELKTCDTDGKRGLSLEELENYKSAKEKNGRQVPEFVEKLSQKFEQLDVNKDGQLNSLEVSALQNNRGLWQVRNIGAVPVEKTTAIDSGMKAKPAATNAQDEAFKHLLQQGYDKLKNQVNFNDVVNKVL